MGDANENDHHNLNITPFSSNADGTSSDTERRRSIPRDGGPLVFRPTTEFSPNNQRAEHKYEAIELDEEVEWKERLHCCNGLFPLDHVVAAVNVMVLVLGIVGICLSSYWIYTSTHGFIGARSLRHLLVTSVFLHMIGAIPIGGLLTFCGGAGLYFKFGTKPQRDQVFNMYILGPIVRRQIDVSYHSILYLCSFINVVYFVTTILAFSHISTFKGVYNVETWPELAKTHPRFHCLLQQRLNCSMQCSYLEKSVRFDNCPGAFCVEFCRVDPSIPFRQSSVHPICRPCKEKGPQIRKFFGHCRQVELEHSITTANSSTNHNNNESVDGSAIGDQSILRIFDEEVVTIYQDIAGHADTIENRTTPRQAVSNNETAVSHENCVKAAARDLIRSSIRLIILATTFMGGTVSLNLATCYRLCYS